MNDCLKLYCPHCGQMRRTHPTALGPVCNTCDRLVPVKGQA